MGKDILSMYGPDANKPQAPTASNGGQMPVKELPYSPPQGPTTFSHQGPGLANHTNHDNCGTQGKR